MREWQGFTAGNWQKEINVRDFIATNYSEYRGSEEFLSVATQKTTELNEKYLSLCEEERKHNGVLDIDVSIGLNTAMETAVKRVNSRSDWLDANQ